MTNGDRSDDTLKGWENVKGKWHRTPESLFCAGNCKAGVLQQDVDVGRFATDIDAGRVDFKAAAQLSSFDADRAQMRVVFLNKDKAVLSTGYDTGEHAPYHIWVTYGDTATAPAGTRFARVVLRSVMSPRPGNAQCSGYPDDISLRALVRNPAAGGPPHGANRG